MAHENTHTYDHIPGATMISCLFVRILRKERSLVGSRSLTVVLVLHVSWWMRPAYCTVVALSRVLLIGIPGGCEHKGSQSSLTDMSTPGLGIG